MEVSYAPGRHPGRRPRRPSGSGALPLAGVLEVVAVVLFIAFTSVVTRGGPAEPNETFFSDPLSSGLILAAAVVAIAAGAVALVSLVRTPLRSRAGLWARRLAFANALLLPVVGLSVTGVAWLVGVDLPEGWGQPIVPFWLATGLASAVLGAIAKEPGRRGLLVLPFMIGAFVLTFWAGEFLDPH